MRRILTIILILCSLCKSAAAQGEPRSAYPKVTFGAEWSYTGTVLYGTHFNFFSHEGYRENITDCQSGYWNNAEALLHVGYNINHNWNISLYTGFCGLADIHNAIPISLRATYAFGKDSLMDRWLTFVDLGTGVSLGEAPQEILTGKLGGGYRLSLSRNTKLDFLMAIRTTYTHPTIIYGENVIPLDKVNRNSAVLASYSLGISLTF